MNAVSHFIAYVFVAAGAASLALCTAVCVLLGVACRADRRDQRRLAAERAEVLATLDADEAAAAARTAEQAEYDVEFYAIWREDSRRAHPSWRPPT